MGVTLWRRRRDLFAFCCAKLLFGSVKPTPTMLTRIAFNCSNPLPLIKIAPIRRMGAIFMAEKEGFEPSKPFWGLHDFQSCALGQLRDFSIKLLRDSLCILQHFSVFVKPIFRFFRPM